MSEQPPRLIDRNAEEADEPQFEVLPPEKSLLIPKKT